MHEKRGKNGTRRGSHSAHCGVLHRLRTICLLVAVVTVEATFAGVAASAPPDAAALKVEVQGLIEHLASPIRAQRTAAEKRLLELGPAVLDHLPPAELLPGTSVQAAVDRVRLDLERRRARESIRPSRVTLTGRRTLAGWLEEIERQSGNTLDCRNLPPEWRDREVEFDGSAREFWPALDSLAQQAGVAFEAVSSRRALKCIPRDLALPDAAIGYAGAFRVEVPAADVRGGANDRQRAASVLRMTPLIQAEPRLRPLFAHYAAADFRASVGARVTLLPFSPEARYELPVPEGAGQARLQLDYILPEAVRAGSLELTGKLRMTVAAGSADIRFVDVSVLEDDRPRVSRRRGGVTVMLERVRRERDAHGRNELRLATTVAYESGGPAFESHRSWMLYNEVFLEDDQGQRVMLNGGYETTLQADGAVGIEYRFVNLPEPLPHYAFVYIAPTLIVESPLQFTVESVPWRGADK